MCKLKGRRPRGRFLRVRFATNFLLICIIACPGLRPHNEENKRNGGVSVLVLSPIVAFFVLVIAEVLDVAMTHPSTWTSTVLQTMTMWEVAPFATEVTANDRPSKEHRKRVLKEYRKTQLCSRVDSLSCGRDRCLARRPTGVGPAPTPGQVYES